MGDLYDQHTIERICSRLRKIVQDSFQKHLYGTAIFYADKLASLSQDAEDLYTLAECYFKNREYRRVLHLLKKHSDSTHADARLQLIAAQCLLECRDWDECLRYLEEATNAGKASMDAKMASAFALLRGKVYEVTENQENALIWYEIAVQYDPYCHEAMERLIGNHLLAADREAALLRSLKFHEEDDWLRHLYAARLTAARSRRPETILELSSEDQDIRQLAPSGDQPAWWGIGRHRRLRQVMKVEGCNEEYPVPKLPPGLAYNSHALAAQSTRYFYQGDYESSYQVSKLILEDDPYHLDTLPVHVAALVMLGMKSVVFYVAHQLVNAYPAAAVAWFTVGCYYYIVRKYEHARRFFQKALSFDRSFAPAWIAYGHAFAQHDESDQALAAYRTASRLFPGSHLPWLFIGMEYVRTNSLQLAHQCLQCARTLMPSDPYVFNEIGVVAYHKRQYSKACELLLQALQLCAVPHEGMCSNLGHAFLKCKAYDRALEAFKQANRLSPRCASVISGIAVCLQLQGRIDEAIEHYHRALSIQRDDVFAAEMLGFAVQELDDQISDMEY